MDKNKNQQKIKKKSNLKNEKMRKLFYFLASVFALTFVSCGDIFGDVTRIYGTGNIMSETRNLESFHSIESRMGADINIIQSNTSYIEIEAQENLLDIMKTEVKNGKLIIHFGKYNVQTSKSIRINVYCRQAESFELYGAGRIVSEFPLSYINISGAGNVNCRGTGQNVNIRINGAGTVDLFDMQVENADVRISGNGTVYVKATNKLDVRISGAGNVYYLGLPEVTKTISGIGNVISRN